MAETPETSRGRAQPSDMDAGASVHELKIWFVREVLSLEADLMQFLQHHGRNRNDLNDLRQEVYLRAYESARERFPQSTRPFVFAIARNILVDQFRRERIIPIDGVPDSDAIEIPTDEPGPDRSAIARDELRRLYAALDRLPPRCREALVMRRVDQLSRREIAQRMGVAEKTVKRHLNDGLRLLVAMLYADYVDERADP